MFYLGIFIAATLYWLLQMRLKDRREFKRFRYSNADSEARARSLAFTPPGALIFEAVWRGLWSTALVFVALAILGYIRP